MTAGYTHCPICGSKEAYGGSAMTPTQAQIDAAAKAICTDKVEPCKRCLRMAKAALTAAAQVGKRTWDNGEPLNLAAAQVKKTYATCDADFLHATTIERCAQKVEVFDKCDAYSREDGKHITKHIAAAIRDLARGEH